MPGFLGHLSRVLALALLVYTPSAAATLYVSPSGNDASVGSLPSPLATPRRALALAVAGDTIVLRGGTYHISQLLTITQPGLMLRSLPGERATLVAGTADPTLTSVVVVYARGVTLEDLDIEGGFYYGIKLDDAFGVQSGITLRRLQIRRTGRDGIKVQRADGVVIEDCEVAFTGVRDASNAEGIDIMATVGVTVRRNYVHDIATTGIFVKAGSRNAVIEANRVERVGYSGILLGADSGAEYMRDGAVYEAIDSVARNNVVVDVPYAGLGTLAGDNVGFENNTVINAARSGQAVFRAAPNEAQTASRNIVLKNNVLVLAPSSARPMVHLFNHSGAFVSDSNTFYSASGAYSFWREAAGGPYHYWTLDQWRAGMYADIRSRAADPMLDAARLFRPLPGSPLVDAGEALAGVTTDYSGARRPWGAAPDVGAHEAVPAVAPPGNLRIIR